MIDKILRKKRTKVPQKIRALLQKEVNSKCPFCEMEDVHHFEVHHIDANVENNIFSNLIMLCPTCHSKVEKNDIPIGVVRKVKQSLEKSETRLSPIELAEFENYRNKYSQLRSEYLRSNKKRVDSLKQAEQLVIVLEEKCNEIASKLDHFYLNHERTKSGHLQIYCEYIYLVVQSYPNFDEYQLSITVNEGWLVERMRGEKRDKFKVYNFTIDINENGDLVWHRNKILYDNYELTDFLLRELIEINSRYSKKGSEL